MKRRQHCSQENGRLKWTPCREQGSTMIIALLITAVLGIVAVSISRNLETSAKSANDSQRRGNAQTAVVSSFALFTKLLGSAGGSLPVIYPDPYITNSFELKRVSPDTSKAWHYADSVLTVYSPNPMRFAANELSMLYAGGQPPTLNASVDVFTRVSLLAVDPPTNAALPYLIPSVVVSGLTTRTDARTPDADKRVKMTARLELPPPPAPSCTITTDAGSGPVPSGSPVTFKTYGSGVIVSGHITDGASQSVQFDSGGMPPTAANSVLSNQVLLGTMTKTVSTSQAVELQTVTAYVTGPQGSTQQCQASVQVAAPPPPPPPPSPIPPPPIPGCGPAGLTQVKLLTPSIRSGDFGSFLEYLVYKIDCNGNNLAFSSDYISFCYAAIVDYVPDGFYTATGSGVTVDGTFTVVYGKDLFGHVSPTKFYRQTQQKMSFGADAKAVLLHIDMGGVTMTPYATAALPYPNNNMETVLQFGEAAPVSVIIGVDPAPTWSDP